jgi:hypothetical protein
MENILIYEITSKKFKAPLYLGTSMLLLKYQYNVGMTIVGYKTLCQNNPRDHHVYEHE